MQSKYQLRVNMTQKNKASRLSRDAVAVVPHSSSDSGEKRTPGIQVRSQSAPTPLFKTGSIQDARSTTDQHAKTSRNYEFWKRTLDLVLGFALLVVAVPIVLCAAAAIRLDTPGSPFFFQTRLGKNGKPFTIFKLRGMYMDARVRYPTYYDYSHKRDLEFCFHHEDDPRVTRAGKFIRKTSIDELPNLWNVVKGDISLVGPRPEIPDVLALYGPYRDEYLSVKPGITCLSKCTGRDRLTKRETIELDLGYIRCRSLRVDFGILWKTFRGVLLRRDVF